MSRKTKPDTNSLEAAMNDVQAGTMSIRAAAAKYHVPRSTLGDRVSGRIAPGARDGKAPRLSAEEETALLAEAQTRAQRGVGFTKKTFLRYAGAYAGMRGVPFKQGVPTEKWWRLMKKRNPSATLRLPESTSAVRHQCMEPGKVGSYFTVLSATLNENQLLNKADYIWNMDESGVQLAAAADRVVAKKGSKYLHSKAGSKEMVTVVAGGNAAGTYLPLHFILKGKTKNALKSWDSENAPAGSQLSVSPNGWTKQGLCLLWFTEVFLPNIGDHRPQLLILDGHDSHHHVELLQTARINNIIIMEMPAHCSNWLQPMDRTVFGPLKGRWKEGVNNLASTTGYPVKHSNFFRLFSQAWAPIKADSSKLVNGFKATGICPLSPSAIPDAAYEPSRAYRRSDGTESSQQHVHVAHAVLPVPSPICTPLRTSPEPASTCTPAAEALTGLGSLPEIHNGQSIKGSQKDLNSSFDIIIDRQSQIALRPAHTQPSIEYMSGVKLLSLGGHSDLNVMISEVKDIRTSAKAFLQAQHLASQDMLRWAAHEDNHAIQDVVSQIAELNTLWTDVQRDFIERLKEFRQMFEMILTGQKHVSQAKTHLNTCEQKEVKVRKELKGAAKRASPAEIRIFETRLTQVQRAKDLAHVEVSDRVRENEAVKLIRLKEGMLKFTESYVEMSTKCTILFSSQREVVLQIPDVHGRDLEDIKYSGSGATRFYVQEARGKLLKYRSNSCSSSASADTMNDPPPPYTPPDAVVTEAVTRNPRPAPRTSLPNPDRDVQHATPPRASLPYPEQNMEHSAGHRTSLPYSDQNMDHSTTSRTSLPYLDQNMEHSTTSHTSLPYPDQNMEHSTGQRTGLPNLDQHMDPSTALPIQNRGQGCGRCDSNSSTCSEGLMSMTKLDHSVTSTRDRGQVSGSFGSTHSSNTSNDGQIPRSNSGTFANVPVQATSQSSGFYESDKGVNPATASYTPRENSVTSTTMSDPNKNKTAYKSMHTPRLETTKLPDRDTGQTSGYYHDYTPNSEITSSYATHIMTQDSKGPEIAMPDSEYYRTPPMTQDQCGGVRPRQLYQPTQRDSIHEDEYSTADEEADGTTSHCDIK